MIPRHGKLGVLNFRDISESTSDNAEGKTYIKPGMVYRSATMENMNEENVNEYVEMYNVRTIVDLRSRAETKKGAAIDRVYQEAIRPPASVSFSPAQVTPSMAEPSVSRRKYRVDFAGRSFMIACMAALHPWYLRIVIVLLLLFCQRKRAALVMIRRVTSPRGVCALYRSFGESSQGEIRTALEHFTDPTNYPIHVHCTQGKDRTGIVIALVLSIVGVPRDTIIKDYAKTQAGLAPVYDDMLTFLRQAGFQDEFANASPHFMRSFLDHLDNQYGSVSAFLTHIGFIPEQQESVRQLLSD